MLCTLLNKRAIGLFGLLIYFVAAGSLYAAKIDPKANLMVVDTVDDQTFRVRGDINSFQIHGGDDNTLAIDCTVAGTVPQLSSSGLSVPCYVRVVELTDVRSATVEIIDTTSRQVFLNEAFMVPSSIDEWSGESPISVSVARMGRRAFLRITVRPFSIDSAMQSITVVDSFEAMVRVSNDDAPISQVSTSAQLTSMEGAPYCTDCPEKMPVGVSPGIGSPGDFFPRRSVTNDVAWKIKFTQAGLYRINGQELENAGVPLAYRDVSKLRLVARDQVIPVWTSTSGVMQSNDWIMFYGAAIDSQTTTQNVYWLAAGVPSPSVPSQNAATNTSAPMVTSAWSKVDFVSNSNFYQSAYQPLDDSHDHWFAMRVEGAVRSNIVFSTPHLVQSGLVHLAYSIYGFRKFRDVNTNFTGPDHRAIIFINNQPVLSRDYTGEVHIAGTITTNASLLTNILSTIGLSNAVPVGVTITNFAASFIKSMNLCYQRILVSSNLPVYFQGPSTQSNVRLTRVLTTNVWLLNVSNPFIPVQLTNYTMQSSTSNLIFGISQGNDTCYALLGTSSIRNVTSMEMVRFRDLADTGRQADYLMVTPSQFRQPAYKLAKHRFKNGLSVQVATPDDISNEFSYGILDPAAIRQYFGYAYHHYSGMEPRYAVLIGNGSYDPLRRLGHGDLEYIPTVQGYANFQRTALEQWFVTVDGIVLSESDLLPDMSLGRVPATNVVDVQRFVDKVIAYETAPTNSGWFKSALLVADQTTNGFFFRSFTESNTVMHLNAAKFSTNFGISKVYLDFLTPVQARMQINGDIQFGTQIVNYMGHGGLSTWSDVTATGVWNRVDAETRTNTMSYPIFTVFTCRSGAFHEPSTRSLAEAITMSLRCGSACVAPSDLSQQVYSEKLADGFYSALASNHVQRLGGAMQEAQLRLWNFNDSAREILFYTIFGDPAQQLWGGARP